MSAFALVYGPDGTPVSDEDINSIRLGFQDHGGKLEIHQLHPNICLFLWHKPSISSPAKIFRNSGKSTVVLTTGHPTGGNEDKLNGIVLNRSYENLNCPFVAIEATESGISLSNDQMGIRGICYTKAGKFLVVASEVRTVLSHPAVSRDVDMGLFGERLAYRPTTPNRCVYKHISFVPGGHALTADRNSQKIRQWHKFDYRVDTQKSMDDWSVEIRRLTERVLKDRFEQMGESPYSLLLSGGLDSAAIAGMLVKLDLDKRGTALLHQYPGLPCDESGYQDATLIGTEFSHQVFNARRVDPESEIVEKTKLAQLPLNRVDPEAKDSSDWALKNSLGNCINGMGGDEIFCTYGESPLDHLRNGDLGGLYAQCSRTPIKYIRNELAEHAPKALRVWWRRENYASFINPEFAKSIDLYDRLERPARKAGHQSLGRRRFALWNDFGWSALRQTGHEGAQRTGLNYIRPFLDPRLFQLLLSVPEASRTLPGDVRALQRQAFHPVLSQELQARRGKVHFDHRHAMDLTLPWIAHLLDNLRLEEDGIVLGDRLRAMHKELLTALKFDTANIPSFAGPLWSTIGLEIWWRSHV